MKKKSVSKEHPPSGVNSGGNLLLMVVIAAFIVSRILYWLAGVRFDAYEHVHLMHFVPANLLREHLWESVFYLHDQPPLFNLFLGAVYSLFPGSPTPVFHLVYLALGLALAVSLHCLMTRLGVSPRLSAALTILFIVSPACILFENLLLYSYPVTVMLCLAALFLLRFLEKRRWRDAFLFFSLLAAVVCMRSMYHFLWFLLFPALLVVFLRNEWKKILFAAALPFIAVLFLYAKNLYLFGSFNSSSWMGMSLSKLTTMRLPVEERNALMKRGKLSELSLIPPFKALWQYGEYDEIPKFEKTGIPVLDLDFFPDEGNNWNNAAYLAISNQYRKDALVVLKTHPGTYLKGLEESFRLFFFPASDWFHIYASVDNTGKITSVERFFNTFLCGQFFGSIAPGLNSEEDPAYFGALRHIGFFILLVFLFSCGYGIWYSFHRFRMSRTGSSAALTAIFMLVCIFYVAAVGNMLEVGENFRFRFDVEPLMLVLFGMFLSGLSEKVRSAVRLDGSAVSTGKQPVSSVSRRGKS